MEAAARAGEEAEGTELGGDWDRSEGQ